MALFCGRCNEPLPNGGMGHVCPGSPELEPLATLDFINPGGRYHIQLTIDVAEVLREANSVDTALSYLRGVNKIFIEGEVEGEDNK